MVRLLLVSTFDSIKGAEARRRITFFVNSLFVEQPKKRRVLEMPSLTTLTPYYNEDVVSTTFVLALLLLL